MPSKRPLPDAASSTRPSGKAPPPLSFSKARACEACRKHKIKCEWATGQSTCVKCERSGLDCVVTDGTQRFLEEDSSWKSDALRQIQELQAAVTHLLQVNQLAELPSYRQQPQESPRAVHSGPKDHPSSGPSPPIVVPSIDMTRENSQEPQTEQGDIVPAPMKSLYALTRLNALGTHSAGKANKSLVEDDFISRGVVSAHDADELFSFYLKNMSQYLWGGILLIHDNLLAVRQSSAMLCAVILTVAAIHMPNVSKDTMHHCYAEYVSIVCSNALSRHHSLDDIRALCLGAFYLPTISWKLSGQAVRIATEMNLHRSFQNSAQASPQNLGDHERARLWCTLYICDCQFSIAYGRPPVTIEDSTIKNYDLFLQSPQVVPGDIRLSAQVSLFRILTDAYQRFGTDMDQVLMGEDFDYLRRFNVALEEWRLSWERRSVDSLYVGSYPSKIVVLYYYFARFQINSLAFRGIAAQPKIVMTAERKEGANAAIAAALSTLMLVTDEPAIRSALSSVPIFTHTMIAFSAAFLLQVAARWTNSDALTIDARHVLGHVTRVVSLMDEVKLSVGENHLTRHIARGLRKLLDNFRIVEDSGFGMSAPQQNNQPPIAGNGMNTMNYTPHPGGFDGNMVGFEGGYNGDGSNGPASENWAWPMNDVRGTYGFGFDEQLLNPFVSDDGSWF